MLIRFIYKSLIILLVILGSLKSNAQSQVIIVHDSVGRTLTYDELEKYQIYPQYKKAAVDSLTFSVNPKGKFFLHIYFSNGIKDYLSVSKKDVYYVHEKINVFERVNIPLNVADIQPPNKIKQVKSISDKNDSTIKNTSIGSHLLDLQLMEKISINNNILGDGTLKNVYPDLTFSFGKIGENIQNKTSLYFSWGLMINKYSSTYYYTDASHYNSITESKNTCIGLEQKIGMITQWKRIGLISAFDFSCDLFKQTFSHQETTITTYTNTFPTHETSSRDYISDFSWQPVPYVDINLVFIYKILNKPKTPYLSISTRLGYFYKNELNLFFALGCGLGFKF